MSTPSSPSTPLKIILLGVGGPSTIAGALADGLLQAKYAEKVKLTVFSRPIEAAAEKQAAANTQPDKKQAAVDSLKSRGAEVAFVSASSGAEKIAPLMKGFDVVISAIGTPGQMDQRIFIEAARLAGVKWFIPSEFGFDYQSRGKGTIISVFADVKVDDLASIKAAGMDWTVFNTGAFTEYMIRPVFGVDASTRTIVFPNSGKAQLSQTPLADIGNIVADAIVTGRGRNRTIYTAAETLTYEAFADLLDRVSGEKWNRVVRTTEESRAIVAKPPHPFAAFIALFELHIGSDKEFPNSAAAWPKEKTYHHQHNIPMHSVEEVIKSALNQKA